MSTVAGRITAYYLFDVAEAFDLAAVPQLIAGPAVPAKLRPKPPTPGYIQYQTPPLSFDGAAVGQPDISGFRVRIRVYDYGVMSLALTRTFSSSWEELIALGQNLLENDRLEEQAEIYCRRLRDTLRPSMIGQRDEFLAEDYLVFAVHQMDPALSAEQLLEAHGEEIARLLRGEGDVLSRQEQEEVLRHRISYLSTDVVVPTWSAALIVDTESGSEAALEILEFANSQLLEFRYYDQLLDARLGRIYPDLQKRRWSDVLSGRRYVRAARDLHSLFIDVNELTDRTENAIKFVGDVYAARLFALAAARLGLERWKDSVRDKLRTLDDIYHFAVEQSGMSRGTFLEATIVLILILELVLLLLGVME